MTSHHKQRAAEPVRRLVTGQTLYLSVIGLGCALLVGYVAVYHGPRTTDSANGGEPSARRARHWNESPFRGAQANDYLTQLCELGPRPSGSDGMRRQQQLLEKHFQELGATVSRQTFRTRHPQNGDAIELANLIVTWHPESKQRLLLAAHYDTRPFPDRDIANPQGRFVGANDGASGVAVLMELAHEMPKLDGKYGVDFVLFDAEEFVFSENDPYFLGSDHFARDYKALPPTHRYRWGVLLDMVGDSDLQLLYEQHSHDWRETRPLLLDVWKTAKRLRVTEFVPQRGHMIRDDHLALRNVAGIPTIDIIDFDYPYWHTQSDLPDRCSADSLAKVGAVVYEWMRTAK